MTWKSHSVSAWIGKWRIAAPRRSSPKPRMRLRRRMQPGAVAPCDDSRSRSAASRGASIGARTACSNIAA